MYFMSKGEEELLRNLHGTTIKVYYSLIKEGREMTLREVQRKTHLSSPSLALYHLNKLKDIELVIMGSDGGYDVAKNVKVGVLRFFIGRGRLIMPRYALYFFFFFTELVAYIMFFGFNMGISDILLFVTLVVACVVALFEAIMMWRTEPLGFR